MFNLNLNVGFEVDVSDLDKWLRYMLAWNEAIPDRAVSLKDTAKLKQKLKELDSGKWNPVEVVKADGFITIKDLKRLYDACRKYGIRTRIAKA